MEKNRSGIHIVLNEGSIDLRREIFEKPQIRNRSPHRTTSHQVLSPSQISAEHKDRKPLKVNGLKKLANNLYYGEQSNILQNRNYFRIKQRGRATSADPRFRRERSPVCSKDASQTQSDSQVMDLPNPNKKTKNKTQSDSKFILDDPVHIKKTMIPKPIGPYPADQSEPVDCHASLDLREKGSPRIENHNRKNIVGKTTSIKYGNVSNLYSCETLTPSNIEQSTMTEDIKCLPAPIDCKSIYQTAVTETDTPRSDAEIKLYNTAEICLDKEPLKSYWDDPRLIEKYSKLLKPVHIRKSKSSLTLPLSENTNYIPGSTKSNQSKPQSSNCVCTETSKPIAYGYETFAEISEKIINYDNIRRRLYKAMRSNYYLAAFFMVGSLCGLMLVTLIIWVLANDIIWSYLSIQEQPKLTGIKWLTAYVGGAILHSINLVFNAIYHMIVMPRNEVFDLLKTEDNT